MVVKSHVIKTEDDDIRNTISVYRAIPVLTKAHVTTKITPNIGPSTRPTETHDKDTECKEPLQCIVYNVVYHRHTSEDSI